MGRPSSLWLRLPAAPRLDGKRRLEGGRSEEGDALHLLLLALLLEVSWVLSSSHSLMVVIVLWF
jgi:hypothetical protein